MKQTICVTIKNIFKNTFLAELRSEEVLLIKNDHTKGLKVGDTIQAEVYEKNNRINSTNCNNIQKKIFEPFLVTQIGSDLLVSDVEKLNKLIKEIKNDITNKKRSRAFRDAIRLLNSNKDLSYLFEEVSIEYRTYLIKADFEKITNLLNDQEEDQTLQAKQIVDELISKKGRFRGLYPLLKELYKFSNEVNARSKIENKHTYTADRKKSRFLSLANTSHCTGQITTFKDRDVEIVTVGRTFKLDSTNKAVPEFLRIKWLDRDVCWIYFKELDGKLSPEDLKRNEDRVKNYYERNTSNPKRQPEVIAQPKAISHSQIRNHIWASKAFISYVEIIKDKGIKPRHRVELIDEIKKADVICDNRKMIAEGGSWVAMNKQYIWYITYQISSLAFDNNIRIYNQPAQCWRMMIIDAPEPMIDELREIHEILFNH